jgi:7-cyano-7-deazaguanine synthase
MGSHAVSLLSGGLDSSTVTTLAKKEVENVNALTFFYGQSHSKEIDCARVISRLLKIKHTLVDISFMEKISWYSALMNPEKFPIPDNRVDTGDIGFSIPITYVPLRNTIFVSLAASLLESNILNSIETHGENPENIEALIYMAPNAIDYSGYPDCRPEFYKAITETINLGSKIHTEYGIPFQIKTPIIDLSKADIARLAYELSVPIEETWSCYRGQSLPCGECDSCILREKGFKEAKLVDPLLQQKKTRL